MWMMTEENPEWIETDTQKSEGKKKGEDTHRVR